MNYLIIGGSTGIGKALSEMLSQDHQVYATYSKNETEHDSIKYYKYTAGEELDTDQLPDIIDGLVYCVGAIQLKPFHRATEEDFLSDFQVQVVGAIKCIQTVLPRLKLSQQASIVLFSTVAVKMGFNFHSIVSTSKGAIEGLTRSLAAEFAPSIRVNCIAPSITNTPLAANLLSTEEKIKANADRHPLKKIGSPADLAQLAAFLLSDKAQWMTGQIIQVDGGISSLKM